MRLTFCLCHMIYKTTRKEYGILQTRHTDVCLDKADGVCRRGRHGKAPCGHFAMPGLFDYPYTFISILLSVLLYIYIATLPYWCIDVLLYCFISTLSYICIDLFMSIWIYRNIIISILVLFPLASSLHARRCCVW